MMRTESNWKTVTLYEKQQAIRTEGSRKRTGRACGDIGRKRYKTSLGQGQRVGVQRYNLPRGRSTL